MTSPTDTRRLTCPKCSSTMTVVARYGIEIDQCTTCGGIFLDAGELEGLSAAEARWSQAQQQPAAPPPPQQGYPQQGYPQQGYPPPPPRRSFLDELFEGGGGHHGGRRRHH